MLKVITAVILSIYSLNSCIANMTECREIWFLLVHISSVKKIHGNLNISKTFGQAF
jgi:hypothetical protein